MPLGNSTPVVALGTVIISKGMGLVGEFEIHCPALLKNSHKSQLVSFRFLS